MENISQSPMLTRNQAAEHLYNTETSSQQVYNMPSQHNDSKFPLPAPKKANTRKQYANMNTLDNNHASANDTELLNHLVPNMNYKVTGFGHNLGLIKGKGLKDEIQGFEMSINLYEVRLWKHEFWEWRLNVFV